MGLSESKPVPISGPVKGYKALSSDFSCRGHKFEVGKTYELPEGQAPELGKRGYHFCLIPEDCDKYYPKSARTRYAEVEAFEVITKDDNCVARKLRIVREIPQSEFHKQSGCFSNSLRTVYLKEGQYHREDGPAMECHKNIYGRASFPTRSRSGLYYEPVFIGKAGDQIWYQNGQKHRVDGPAFVNAIGDQIWYQGNIFHREDGPAIERANGDKEWYRHNRRHREDGPAIERANGDKEWYYLGHRHRDNGPAKELANGDKEWYYNNDRHRTDGPAVEEANGNKEWYKAGKLHREDGPAIERIKTRLWGKKEQYGAWYQNDWPYYEDTSNNEFASEDLWYINGKRLRKALIHSGPNYYRLGS